jgi:hypothetical protein
MTSHYAARGDARRARCSTFAVQIVPESESSSRTSRERSPRARRATSFPLASGVGSTAFMVTSIVVEATTWDIGRFREQLRANRRSRPEPPSGDRVTAMPGIWERLAARRRAAAIRREEQEEQMSPEGRRFIDEGVEERSRRVRRGAPRGHRPAAPARRRRTAARLLIWSEELHLRRFGWVALVG